MITGHQESVKFERFLKGKTFPKVDTDKAARKRTLPDF